MSSNVELAGMAVCSCVKAEKEDDLDDPPPSIPRLSLNAESSKVPRTQKLQRSSIVLLDRLAQPLDHRSKTSEGTNNRPAQGIAEGDQYGPI